jgi:hypothetical protein
VTDRVAGIDVDDVKLWCIPHDSDLFSDASCQRILYIQPSSAKDKTTIAARHIARISEADSESIARDFERLLQGIPTSLSLDLLDLAEWIPDIKCPVDLASALLCPTQRLGPVADFRLPLADR